MTSAPAKMVADHSKFLYTILKQLDLKSIDWAAVATQLGITNGHAARMRFSRFKQAMEGVVPAPRKRTPGGNSNSHRPRRVKTEKAIKAEKADAKAKAEAEADAEAETDSKANIDVIKTEQQRQEQDVVTSSPRAGSHAAEMTTNTIIKSEPVDVHDTTMLEAFPGQGQGMMGGVSHSGITTSAPPMLDPALAQMSINSPGSGSFHAPISLLAPSGSGPSRHEFGPFAGTYPPPGMTLSMQRQQQQHSQADPVMLTQKGRIKTEPQWDA